MEVDFYPQKINRHKEIKDRESAINFMRETQGPTNHMIRYLKIRFKIRFDRIMKRILDFRTGPNQIANRILSYKIYRIRFRIES